MNHALTVIVLTYEGPAPERPAHIVRRVFVMPGATPADVLDYVGGAGRLAVWNDSHGIDHFVLMGFRRLRPDMDFESVGGAYQLGGLEPSPNVTLRCDGVVSALAKGITDGQVDGFVAQLAAAEKDRKPAVRQVPVVVQRSDDTDGMSA